ncbi:hybrid sensor histidine kinase/response regulator [Eleftheria terrae]|uniref:hybrid sensor histidine kinase/response regulator n=1 Tax=Eleftheria terrae TaxID=1597781 RepID=UPI00263A6D83|nr:hybrid sensor histidine kinase/response regulator [Eleftheria terrae]WKB50844.1 PAS domain-containing protein [Eleftheria terrae]
MPAVQTDDGSLPLADVDVAWLPAFILAHLRDVVCVHEPDGRCCYVSPSVSAALGYMPKSLLGKLPMDHIHPDDRAGVAARIAALRESGELNGIVCYRYRHSDGHWVWLESLTTPVKDISGKVTGMVSVSRDVSERFAAEQRAVAQERLLQKLSEQLPGMLYQYRQRPDGSACFTYASEAIRCLFGVSPQAASVSAESVFKQIQPDDLPLIRQRIEHSAQTLTPWRCDFRVAANGERNRWLEAHAMPERLPDGSVVWHGYCTDVTERRELEQELSARGAAANANRAKTQFLTRMSHELRTPLNAVIGFAQLMLMDQQLPLRASQRRHAENILAAGRHVLSMLNDVLELSTIEAGGVSLSMEPTLVCAVVGEAVALVTPDATRRQVDLHIHPSQTLAHVCADRTRLRQVLVNLLSNAIKYNHPGGAVSVSMDVGDADVAVHVTDTGRGLSPEQLEQLYQPFNRLGADRSIEGTGIGLVITRTLVDAMKGRLTVRSAVNEGSTFTVELRRVHPPVAAARPTAMEKGPALAAQKERLVVYAEDNEVNVMLLKEVLQFRPFIRLCVADSGSAALQLLESETPDLLLLDMHLGDMTGTELLEEIKKTPRLAGVVAVALSADAMPEQVRLALRRGFADYLVKPIDVTAVLECVDRHLSAVAGGAQTGATPSPKTRE